MRRADYQRGCRTRSHGQRNAHSRVFRRRAGVHEGSARGHVQQLLLVMLAMALLFMFPSTRRFRTRMGMAGAMLVFIMVAGCSGNGPKPKTTTLTVTPSSGGVTKPAITVNVTITSENRSPTNSGRAFWSSRPRGLYSFCSQSQLTRAMFSIFANDPVREGFALP